MDGTVARSVEELSRHMFQLRVTQYTATVGTVVYFYDYLLTLNDEITLFWKTTKKIALVRVLYLVTRYVPAIGLLCALIGIAPFLSQMTIEMYALAACDLTTQTKNHIRCRLTIYGAAICTMSTVTATAIFCVRMYTLHRASRIMRICLAVSFWLSVVLQFAFASFAFVKLNPLLRVVDNNCAVPGPTSDIMQLFMALSVLSPLICEVVVIYSMIKHAFDRSAYLDPKEGSPVLRRLYQDGALYFAIVFSLRVSSSFVWFFVPIHLKPVFDYPTFALTSTFTCRFALALRLAANPPTPTYLETTAGISVGDDFTAAVGTGGGSSGRGPTAAIGSGSGLRKGSHPSDTFWLSGELEGVGTMGYGGAMELEDELEGGGGTATPSSIAQASKHTHPIDAHRLFVRSGGGGEGDLSDTSHEDFELRKIGSDRTGIGDPFSGR